MFRKLFAMSLLALISSTTLVHSHTQKTQTSPGRAKSVAVVANAPLYKVQATALFHAYSANSVGADERFRNKTVLVSGVVDSIETDVMGTPYLALRVGSPLDSVQCLFEEERAGDLAQIKRGQSVQVQGRCDGQTLNVTLRNCRLAP